ncbi:MAG: ABC transporter ATP-binding protein [Candidatus Freyarchaeota archaeon]
MNILEIEDLNVVVDGKKVLQDFNLEVPEGEVHVIFGPNGSGKSSLIFTLLGFKKYKVVSGSIRFKGEDITNLPTNERIKRGIGVTFQHPPAIRGVKLGNIVKNILKKNGGETGGEKTLARKVNFPASFLERDLNCGFSGGEVKRSEVLQILAQKPEFIMLDEPDSGVDVENLWVIGKVINELLEGKSGILITHHGHILRYVRTNRAHVLIKGCIACSGDPPQILDHILREGYWWCDKCRTIKREP